MELKGVLPDKAHGINSPFVWDVVYTDGEHRGKPISLVLFGGGGTTNPRYFYRKNSDFNRVSAYEDDIDDMALYKALVYLEDHSLARQPNRNIINLETQLDKLYNDFVIKYKQQILEVHKNGNTSRKNSLLADSEQEEKNKTTEQFVEDMINNDFESVSDVISKFYESVSIKSLNDSWEQLSPSFQQRVWKSDFSRFESGYVNTRGIRNVSIRNLKQTARNIVDCVVSYEDEIEALSTIELDSLSGMTVKDLDAFVDIVTKLKEDIKTWGGSNFEKIELYKLFEPASSEYIWYKCNLPVDKLEEVFSRKKTIFINRNYICTCHKIIDNWYIERIRPMPTYSTR